VSDASADDPGDDPCAWADAQLDLASRAWNEWDLARVVELTTSVLSLDPSLPAPSARWHAALMLAQARDNLEQAVDEPQLRWARAALEAADEHFAAAGASSLLASLAARRGERDAARHELDRAETRYILAGSLYGVPGCERRRARLCMDEGDLATARVHLRRAQHLAAQLPKGLENAKALVRDLDTLDRELTARAAGSAPKS
jgi:hypothetical protein